MSDTTAPKPKKKPGLRGAAKKEAFHHEAEKGIKDFRLGKPRAAGNDRLNYYLASTPFCKGTVQVFPKGQGDLDMHYHPGVDSFWMVLQGRVRFYSPDGVVGDYGVHEGLVTPHNARYWFESIDDAQDTHLLHIFASTGQKVAKNRIKVDRSKTKTVKSVRIGYPKDSAGGD
jgi:mannose-6-phosphate isomerase-like protein (cupin superfamily)